MMKMELNEQINELVEVLQETKLFITYGDVTVGETTLRRNDTERLAEAAISAGFRKQREAEWLAQKGERGAGSEVSYGSVYSYTYYICSMCNGDSERKTSYCPHCGAHMKGGESDA